MSIVNLSPFPHSLSISSSFSHSLSIFSQPGWQAGTTCAALTLTLITKWYTSTFSQSGGGRGCPLPLMFVNDSIVKRGIPSLTIWAMSHHMCYMSQRKSTSQEVYFHAVPPRPHHMWYKCRSDTITSDSLREKEGKSVLQVTMKGIMAISPTISLLQLGLFSF